MADRFRALYQGKANERGNPVFDPRIATIDIPTVVRRVKEGAVADAFSHLELKGLGHKLRSFFLRDLITLFDVEEQLRRSIASHLWCQPVDVWVRMVSEELMQGTAGKPPTQSPHKYGLSRQDFDAAHGLIEGAFEAGVSPLLVNQGIWYFCANVGADEARVRALVRGGIPEQLDQEVDLLDGCLPVASMWGAA